MFHRVQEMKDNSVLIRRFCLSLGIILLLPNQTHSLEVTANDASIRGGADLVMRQTAFEQLVVAALNAATEKIGKCSANAMLYAPTSPHKDADGCVALAMEESIEAINNNMSPPKTVESNGWGVRKELYNLTTLVGQNVKSVRFTVDAIAKGTFCNNVSIHIVDTAVSYKGIGAQELCRENDDEKVYLSRWYYDANTKVLSIDMASSKSAYYNRVTLKSFSYDERRSKVVIKK